MKGSAGEASGERATFGDEELDRVLALWARHCAPARVRLRDWTADERRIVQATADRLAGKLGRNDARVQVWRAAAGCEFSLWQSRNPHQATVRGVFGTVDRVAALAELAQNRGVPVPGWVGEGSGTPPLPRRVLGAIRRGRDHAPERPWTPLNRRVMISR